MSDILKYRIPSREKVEQTGVFRQVESFSGKEGFVVSSFDKLNKYVFHSGDVEGEIHYSKEKPVVSSKEEYVVQGTRLLEALKKGQVDKAILSRVHRKGVTIDPESLFEGLCEAYPQAFVYLISSELFGTWIGATPEVLIGSFTHQSYFTEALAGTKLPEDEWTDKELTEQRMVDQFILKVLQSEDVRFPKSMELKTVDAGPVQHLLSGYHFQTGKDHLVRIAEALHPTPAVSGLPRNKSLELIHANELHRRELYTGYIGSLSDEVFLFVNLRCAQLFENECYLYLGGGYTSESVVENEWRETENKARTLLDVIENL